MNSEVQSNENVIVKTIAGIIDTSGSMYTFGNEPYQSIKSLVKEQQATGVDFHFTLLKFGDKVKFICPLVSGLQIRFADDNLPKEAETVVIKKDDFQPGGMTALYDGIGRTIDYLKETGYTSNVLLFIITDGQENASQEYTSVTTKKMIQEMETDYGMKTLYLGANQNSFTTRENIGFSPLPGATSNFATTSNGLREAVSSLSNNLSRCISSTDERVSDFEPCISTNVPLQRQQAVGINGNSYESLQPAISMFPPSSLPSNSFPTISLAPAFSIRQDFEVVPNK